jgi:hypothetical protein
MSANADDFDEVERIVGWQCIGCGRIVAPQPCLGVCQERKVALVSADAYEAAMARLRDSEARLAALEGLAFRLALSTPRRGEWEKSYRTLQEQARRALHDAPPAAPAPQAQKALSREYFVEP